MATDIIHNAGKYKLGILFLQLIYLALMSSLLVNFSSAECDTISGPAGATDCFLAEPYYTGYQCGTCLSATYIEQKSLGTISCRNSDAKFCYLQCMVEVHRAEDGDILDDCQCSANQTISPSTLLPASCMSPDGTDCTWYSRCLAIQYPCQGQAEYAISYGEKFCTLHQNKTSALSELGTKWLEAVHKCLQVQLAPALRVCGQAQHTCEEVKKKALNTHSDCYTAPYQGFSLCLLECKDYIHIFFSVQKSFSVDYVESLKGFVMAMRACPWSTPIRKNCVEIALLTINTSVVNKTSKNKRSVADDFERISAPIRKKNVGRRSVADKFEATNAQSIMTTSENDSAVNGKFEKNIVQITKKNFSRKRSLVDDDIHQRQKEDENAADNDEIAHHVMKAISSKLGWDETSSVVWYAVATPNELDGEISIELFLAEYYDFETENGAMKKNLDETIAQLSKAISQGLTISVPILNSTVDFNSLKACEPEMVGESCENGKLLAPFGDEVETTPNVEKECRCEVKVQDKKTVCANGGSIFKRAFWFQWAIICVVYYSQILP